MTATVRRAVDSDAEAISEIISDVLSENIPVAFEAPMSPQEVRDWLARQGNHGAMFVVDDDGRVVAFASVDRSEEDASECSYGAWVRLDSRRQGHATALAEEALAFARDHPYRHIRGRLPDRNEAALSYLSSIGAMVPYTNPGAHFELPLTEE